MFFKRVNGNSRQMCWLRDLRKRTLDLATWIYLFFIACYLLRYSVRE